MKQWIQPHRYNNTGVKEERQYNHLIKSRINVLFYPNTEIQKAKIIKTLKAICNAHKPCSIHTVRWQKPPGVE